MFFTETEIKTEIENPEYVKLNNMEDKDNKENKENKDKVDRKDHKKTEFPEIEKTITKISKIDTLEVKFITEKYKNISTLYLRENNYNELFNFISLYKVNRQKLIDYGLPDKLGVFLHGLAGTGKTSTILSIASFLKKDIYHIDLKSCKTNKNLTQMFNYVNDNSTNGGIIVMEDIDAMTQVVLKRTQSNQNQSNDDNLTLSHVLNLLQGTLTKDGTMFIVTSNHKDHLDPAFFREGRFDIDIEMKNADRYQCNRIYKNFIGRDIKKSLLDTIPENEFTPAKFIFFIAKRLWKINDNDEEIIQEFLNSLDNID